MQDQFNIVELINVIYYIGRFNETNYVIILI